MPIYEYRCEKCDNDFEKLIFSSKKESVECPDCGTKKVKRLLSTTRFIGGEVGDCAPHPGSGFS